MKDNYHRTPAAYTLPSIQEPDRKLYKLPKGEGFYLLRQRDIYVAIRMEGKKKSYPTGFKITDEGLSDRKLMEIKKAKWVLMAATLEDPTPKLQKGVRVKDLFDDYVRHLEEKEREKGVGSGVDVGERNNSYNVRKIIDRSLLPFFGSLSRLDADSLAEYRAKRAASYGSPEKVAWASINGEFRLLRATMRRGWKNGKVKFDDLPKEYPFNHTGERNAARTGTITEEQIKSLAEAMPEYLKAVFLTCVYTGIRPIELRRLLVNDVVLNGSAPRINSVNRKMAGKAPKPKVLAIPLDELLPVLVEYDAKRRSEFPNAPHFFHHNGKRLQPWSFNKPWYAALKACGIEKGTVLFYDARRTSRTIMADLDISKEDAKKQLGHETDEMSAKYDQSTAHVERIQKAFKSKGKPKVAEAPVVAQAPSVDLVGQLRELIAMRNAGDLTPEEFALVKAKLVA